MTKWTTKTEETGNTYIYSPIDIPMASVNNSVKVTIDKDFLDTLINILNTRENIIERISNLEQQFLSSMQKYKKHKNNDAYMEHKYKKHKDKYMKHEEILNTYGIDKL